MLLLFNKFESGFTRKQTHCYQRNTTQTSSSAKIQPLLSSNMPRHSRITVVETDYTPNAVPTRKIPYSGPSSEWSGVKTTFVEKDPDFSFITQRNSKAKPRIIEHPAKSNHHCHEYRFCHPDVSSKKVKAVAPRKPRAEFARRMDPIISNDGLFYIRSLSSFKFAMKDMETHNDMRQTIRFKKHGCDNTWIEFCPGFCYHKNPIMKKYIDESGSMKKMGSWANSTNKLPGWKCSNKWGWRKGIDFFEYRDDKRKDTKMRQVWRL